MAAEQAERQHPEVAVEAVVAHREDPEAEAEVELQRPEAVAAEPEVLPPEQPREVLLAEQVALPLSVLLPRPLRRRQL